MKKLLHKLVSPIVIALYQSLKNDAELWNVQEDNSPRVGKTWIVNHVSGRFAVTYYQGEEFEEVSVINRSGMKAADIGFLERLVLTHAIKSRVSKHRKEQLMQSSLENVLNKAL